MKIEKIIFKSRYLILLFLCVLTTLLNVFPKWKESFSYPSQILLISGILFVLALFLVKLFLKKKLELNDIILIIFAFGFILRLVYCQSTDYFVRQHDVGGKNGHIAYIQRFLNNEGLNDTIKWQYYQPPAWHFLSSLWIKFQYLFDIPFKVALENLQHISLFCSSAIMLLSHKLFRMFNLKGIPLCIACAVIAFHPTFIILSGSINNDILSITFSLLSVILALKWYRDPKFSTIILLAISIGSAMAVKLSAGLISVGIAILFAIVLFGRKNKKYGKKYKDKLKYIGQYAVFGVICIPMALWWPIRNMILFDIPLTYVPKLSEKADQFIGFRTKFERLFDISTLWDNGVYPAKSIEGYGFEYFDHNIPITALKTSVFGEYYLGRTNSFVSIFAIILFYSAALLAIISLVSAIYLSVKAFKERDKRKKEIQSSEIIYPAICALTILLSYVKFCFDYPHFCTMDFRYIALTIVFGALYLGLMLKEWKNNNKMFGKVVFYAVLVLTVLITLCSFELYASIV